MATQSWLNREYRRGLRTQPCEDQRSRDVVSYLHHLGATRQEVQNPVALGGVETQGLKLNDEFGGYYGVEC